MCNYTKQYEEKLKDLNHVKILAVSTSGMKNEAQGIYKDKDFYRYEPVRGREYICITQLINGQWQV